MDIQLLIRQMTARLEPEIVAFRRHLHQHPELSFQEHATSSFVQQKLNDKGISFRAGVAGTGIVASISGRNPQSRVVVLRADMDALPIQEETAVDFCSVNPGVMHACGHDAHTACLLGAAYVLHDLRNHFEGTVLCLFQPGEEMFPGGARLMLDEGVLDGIQPYCILGAHVMPTMACGKVGFRPGNYMASGDEVYLTVKGKGGHGGMPHMLTDNVLIASHLVVALQQVVSRIVPATVPAVLSFGKFIANGATNIIPEKVHIEGTLRTLDEHWRAEMKKSIRSIAGGMATAMGGECEVEIKDGYPAVYNNPERTRRAIQYAGDFLGTDQVEEMDIRMTAEDFGFYSQAYPSVFYRFGVMQEHADTGNLHTPRFNLNENALSTASAVMTYLAISFLME